jgi:hypothetical protein
MQDSSQQLAFVYQISGLKPPMAPMDADVEVASASPPTGHVKSKLKDRKRAAPTVLMPGCSHSEQG